MTQPRGTRSESPLHAVLTYTCGHRTCMVKKVIELTTLSNRIEEDYEKADQEAIKSGFKLINHMWFCTYCAQFHEGGNHIKFQILERD